jgi:hypothetical protein
MVVQLSILVGNVVDLLGMGFTRIEVWASEDQGNSYFEITDGVAKLAVLDSDLPQNFFPLGGKLLKLSLNEAPEVSIPFSSVTPLWTPAQVVSRINEVIPGHATENAGKVRLTSATPGRTSTIRVTYSDCVELGWSDLPLVRGKDVRPTLVSDTYLYTHIDLAGRDSYRYKWRFSVNGSLPISDFSNPPVYGSVQDTVDSDSLSVAIGKFMGMDGKPQKTKLIVAAASTPYQYSSSLLMANSRPLIVESDESGYFQMTLIRGLKVRVAVEGTAFVREFTVPSTPTFDILQAMADAPDPFTVEVPLPFLIRRSI